MLNLQATEKQVESPHLDVFKVWPTIQGEGPYAGKPAVFVRLAGCNLQCPLCDTDYTSTRRKYSLFGLANKVDSVSAQEAGLPIKLVVITGGEPFRQKLAPLVQELYRRDYIVQIETNGTLYEEKFPHDQVTLVCSPKTPSLNKQLAPHIHAFKYVVEYGKVDHRDGLPTSVLGLELRAARPPDEFRGTVYVQPCDHQDPFLNKQNMHQAIDSCMRFGYRLCLQMHKYAGLE
jgi:7-carboxy-7-deazaguanine synthase